MMKDLDFMRMASGAMFLALALVAANNSFFKPYHNWDMIGYVAAAKSFEEKDVLNLQSFAYSEVRNLVTPETFTALTSGHYRSTMSEDPSAFGEQLSFYQIRPLYNGLIYLLYKSGFNAGFATYIISGASVVLSILIVWLVCRERIIGPLLFTIPMFALVLGFIDVARNSTPDALATLFVALSVYFYLSNRYRALLLILPIMIFVRTDLIIFVVLLSPFLLFQGVNKRLIGVSVIASFSAYYVIGSHWGNPGWETIFYVTLVERLTHPITVAPDIEFHHYLAATIRGLLGALKDRIFMTYIIIFWFSLATIFFSKETNLRVLLADSAVTLMAVCFLYIAVHFLAFPVMWSRFFSIFYLVGLIALMFAVSQRCWQKAFCDNQFRP